jgi:hypothetical protein
VAKEIPNCGGCFPASARVEIGQQFLPRIGWRDAKIKEFCGLASTSCPPIVASEVARMGGRSR